MHEHGVPTAWQPVEARVEWRAERHGRERPVAVLWAGERFRVAAILDLWTEGPVDAGAPHIRVVVMRDETGQLWRVRDRAAGVTEVERGR